MSLLGSFFLGWRGRVESGPCRSSSHGARNQTVFCKFALGAKGGLKLYYQYRHYHHFHQTTRSGLVRLPHAYSGAVFPFRAAALAFQDHTPSPLTFAPLRVSSLLTEQLQAVPSTIYLNSIFTNHKGNVRLPKNKLLSGIIACLVYPAEHRVGSRVESRHVNQMESCEERTEGSPVEPHVETEVESC